jgi:hypothetical protein
MEEVAVSPMIVAAVVLDNNGADAVSCTAIPSVTISLEEKENINGDVPTITSAASNEEEALFSVGESTKDDGHRLTMECSTPVSSSSPSTRKKRGAFSLFRAMFLSFGRSDDSMKKTDDDTTSPKKRAIAAADDDCKPAGDESTSWKRLVDGMRPLRLRGQLEYYPPPPPPPPLGHADVYHDVILPPPSQARFGFEIKEVGMTSRYASAEDLHQMDSDQEEGAEGGDDGDSSCPHAIDMQAEEFITKFYEQFKSESFNGRASE